MKRVIALILIIVFLILSFGSIGLAQYESSGPAPNFGDGESDGSGLDAPFGKSDNPGLGPAPNHGDGDPDGSGF